MNIILNKDSILKSLVVRVINHPNDHYMFCSALHLRHNTFKIGKAVDENTFSVVTYGRCSNLV